MCKSRHLSSFLREKKLIINQEKILIYMPNISLRFELCAVDYKWHICINDKINSKNIDKLNKS